MACNLLCASANPDIRVRLIACPTLKGKCPIILLRQVLGKVFSIVFIQHSINPTQHYSYLNPRADVFLCWRDYVNCWLGLEWTPWSGKRKLPSKLSGLGCWGLQQGWRIDFHQTIQRIIWLDWQKQDDVTLIYHWETGKKQQDKHMRSSKSPHQETSFTGRTVKAEILNQYVPSKDQIECIGISAPTHSLSHFPDSQRNLKYSDTHKTKINRI